MNEAFKEKDEKYRNWATKETREKKGGNVVMVPLIITHDGAVHRDTVRRWKSFAPDVEVDWVRMAQNCSATMSSSWASSSRGEAGSQRPGGKSIQKSSRKSPQAHQRESLRLQSEESG